MSEPAETRKPNSISWIGMITIGTAMYYWITFLFELGYFSRFIQFMSAFSVSDHTLHASASAIPATAVMILGVGGLRFVHSMTGGSFGARTSSIFNAELPLYHKICWVIISLAFTMFTEITVYTDGFNIISVLSIITTTMIIGIVILSILGLLRFPLHDTRILLFTAVISLTILPLLGGYILAGGAIISDDAKAVSPDGKELGSILFIGTERMLITGGNSICLLAGDGKVLAVERNPSVFKAIGKRDCSAR